jgi:hypothetical protein
MTLTKAQIVEELFAQTILTKAKSAQIIDTLFDLTKRPAVNIFLTFCRQKPQALRHYIENGSFEREPGNRYPPRSFNFTGAKRPAQAVLVRRWDDKVQRWRAFLPVSLSCLSRAMRPLCSNA